ncbi:MAG: hypoxanthine phosphoribosyltransferase [Bacteroidales bacterium]|nr:hypoxanthine phosphoribosyltransferase [Bacteroidales bacterium]
MTEQSIICNGRRFRPYISAAEIEQSVMQVAAKMNHDLRDLRDDQGRGVLLLPVLNGAYMFAADLSRHLEIDAEICFVKMSSYEGTSTTGKLHELIGFPGSLAGRHVVVVEDVVDTGLSMQQIISQLHRLGVASVRVCTFLFKPGKFRCNYQVDYVGRNIDNEFIVGYGLDYDEHGRLYREIYILDE